MPSPPVHRALALASLLLGCGGAPPLAEGAPPALSDPPPGDAAPTPSPPSPPDSAPSTGAAPAPAPPAAAPELPRAEVPAPLTPGEQKELQSKCRPLVNAVERAGKRERGALADTLRDVLAKPPRMAKGDLDRCSDLLLRAGRGYVFAAFQVEARAILGRLARGMVAAYQERGALCPSTDRPVPADASRVARAPYESTAVDWDTPAWKCLGFSMEGQPLRFQYEVRTDPGAKTFDLIARGSPEQDGKFIELVQHGTVKDGRVEVTGAIAK